MPIYGFECTACGHRFDRLQKLSDPDPDTCPACGQSTIRRQLTAPQFRLAGGGWYETDFKKDGDRKRNLADSGDTPPAAAASAAGAGSESKSASAPAPASAPAAAPAAPASPPPSTKGSGG